MPEISLYNTIEPHCMSDYNFEKHTSENLLQQLILANFYREVLNLLRSLELQSILDVGAGEGFTMKKLKMKNEKLKIVGIEYSEDSVKIANKIYPDLDIRLGNIYNLKFKDDSFDCVLCMEVLEHLDDPVKALAELKRVTKRYLLLSVPNEPYFTIQRFLRGKNLKGLGAHPEHIQWWTHEAFLKFLKKNKLEILSKKAPFSWTLVLAEKERY